ncbi:hypothetical protein SAMN05216490_1075 [Mucilaginibacter mallensis]|uniref:Fibronectin type-III domain-containing protein n=1 Tax=Mucilaginibacter mallensis TaxID=652787 RepID=A0A1H1RUX6_MUCMA|nr:hypothetical protein [Mucilaginibacter mallensis]SDS39445.1 hypothetical protein SAMN05216490_1075 [Mucilaginibacter mallensis]
MRSRLIFLCIIAMVISIAGCVKSPTVFPATGKPQLLTPVLNQVCTTGTVVSDSVTTIPFSWKAVADADSYEFAVENLLNDSVITKITTKTALSIDLLPNTPYAWWVISRSLKTPITTSSDVWKFYSSGSGTLTYAPFPAEIDAPLFGEVVNQSMITLVWKGISVDNNIKSYDVYFGTSNTPPLLKKGETYNEIPDVSVKANTTYYWHVITYDAYGDYTDSGLYQFSVTSF